MLVKVGTLCILFSLTCLYLTRKVNSINTSESGLKKCDKIKPGQKHIVQNPKLHFGRLKKDVFLCLVKC